MSFSALNVSSAELEYLSERILDNLIENSIRGQCLEIHRDVKLGLILVDETQISKKHEIVNQDGLDVFGRATESKKFDCELNCPNCNGKAVASFFARHLAGCMGFGRNRKSANERVAVNTGKSEVESEIEDFDSDNNNDSDWNDNSDRKAKKKKQKTTTRKLKGRKGKNADSAATDSSDWNYDVMSSVQKISVLDQVCGVISEHTNKICARGKRCHIHTDVQRKNVRELVLNSRNHNADGVDDDHVDVDSVD